MHACMCLRLYSNILSTSHVLNTSTGTFYPSSNDPDIYGIQPYYRRQILLENVSTPCTGRENRVTDCYRLSGFQDYDYNNCKDVIVKCFPGIFCLLYFV